MSLRRSGGGGGSGGGANKIKEGGADWRQDSVARMAKRADQMQGPHNVFTWLRDAREACASLEPSELLLYRQAGWSIEQIVSHCRVVGGAELPFPSTFRASNEEIVTAAFQGGESRRGSPRSSDAPSIVQVSKRGDLERKNGAGMWAPCFCVLSDSFLLVFDTEAQYKRLKRSRSQSSASLAEVAPHSYGLNEAEAVCRLGREIHLFRCMGKLLRLRSTTSELASEWVEALAIAGAQSTKDGELLSQSQLVSQAYLQQLSGHLNSLRTKLGAEFEASIADMARAKKAELQQLRTNLDEELSRKQEEHRATEQKYKTAIQDRAQAEAKEQKDKEAREYELARRAAAAYDPNNPDAVEVIGGYEVDSVAYLDREYKGRLAQLASRLLDGELNAEDKVLLGDTAQGRSEAEEAELFKKMTDAVPSVDVAVERGHMREHVRAAEVLQRLDEDLEQRHRILLSNLHAQHKAAFEREVERQQQLLSLERERLLQEAQVRRARVRAAAAEKRRREHARAQLDELRSIKEFESQRAKAQRQVERVQRENEVLQQQLKALDAEERAAVGKLRSLEHEAVKQRVRRLLPDDGGGDKEVSGSEEKTTDLLGSPVSLVQMLLELCQNVSSELGWQGTDSLLGSESSEEAPSPFGGIAATRSYGQARDQLMEHRTSLQRVLRLLREWSATHRKSKCNAEALKKRDTEESLKKPWLNGSCRSGCASVLCLRHTRRVWAALKRHRDDLASGGVGLNFLDDVDGEEDIESRIFNTVHGTRDSPKLCKCLAELLVPVVSYSDRLQQAVDRQDAATGRLLDAIEQRQITIIDAALKRLQSPDDRDSFDPVVPFEPLPFLVNGPSMANVPAYSHEAWRQSHPGLSDLVNGQLQEDALKTIESFLWDRAAGTGEDGGATDKSQPSFLRELLLQWI